MLDLFHTNPFYTAKTFQFGGFNVGASQTDWQLWEKPPCKMVQMLLIGPGGGGGGGRSGAAGTQRGGGGGGGSGGIALFMYPAWVLPDRIYVHPGQAGTGGNANTSGSIQFAFTRVTTAPTAVTAGNTIAMCQNSVSGGGGAGTTSAGGAGGSAGTTTSSSLTPWGSHGLVAAIAGSVGVAGHATGAGTDHTALSGHIITGGAGGAGAVSADAEGGGIIGNGVVPSLLGGLVSAGRLPEVGFTGVNPLASTGGTGGGSDNDGTGQAGADGGIGSGGGGGGAGVTGGKGGNGGPGLILIWAWG